MVGSSNLSGRAISGRRPANALSLAFFFGCSFAVPTDTRFTQAMTAAKACVSNMIAGALHAAKSPAPMKSRGAMAAAQNTGGERGYARLILSLAPRAQRSGPPAASACAPGACVEPRELTLSLSLLQVLREAVLCASNKLAEREGFEPSIELLTLYSLSRGAPSASRASLRELLQLASGAQA